jgi:hypothetical protein
VTQGGNTAWISKRPFQTLSELEKNMPKKPVYEEVRDWFQPHVRFVQEVYAQFDVAYIGCVEGPITDALYLYGYGIVFAGDL